MNSIDTTINDRAAEEPDINPIDIVHTLVGPTKRRRRHLNAAQGYSHLAPFVAVVMLVIMAVEARRWRKSALAIGIFLAMATLSACATILSVVYHHDVEDGVVNRPNVTMVSTSLVSFVIIGCVFWCLVGLRAPFQQSPLFKYIIICLLMCAAIMPFLFYRSFKNLEQHTNWLEKEGITGNSADQKNKSYWSFAFEQYTLYHIQWHTWAGFFSLFLVITVYILIRTHCT